jgi:hypothetical protein
MENREMLSQLGAVKDKKEVMQIIHSIQSMGNGFYIWQNFEEKGRIGFDVESEQLTLDKKFTVRGQRECSTFIEGEDLFFFYEKQMVIFKTRVLVNNRSHLILSPPDQMQLRNTRAQKRLNLLHTADTANISKKNRNATPTRYRLKLFDLSEGGASFILTSEQGNNINENNNIKIHGVNKTILSPYLDSTVCYKVPFKVGEKNCFKIGVKFDREISKTEIYEMIGKKI